jgi:hypothetical protein
MKYFYYSYIYFIILFFLIITFQQREIISKNFNNNNNNNNNNNVNNIIVEEIPTEIFSNTYEGGKGDIPKEELKKEFNHLENEFILNDLSYETFYDCEEVNHKHGGEGWIPL